MFNLYLWIEHLYIYVLRVKIMQVKSGSAYLNEHNKLLYNIFS